MAPSRNRRSHVGPRSYPSRARSARPAFGGRAIALAATLCLPLAAQAEGRSSARKAEPTTTDVVAAQRAHVHERSSSSFDAGRGASARLDLEFQAADIRKAIEQLAQMRKLSVVFDRDVAGKVTAKLRGVTWDEAMRAILAAGRLSMVRDGNVIYVFAGNAPATRDSKPGLLGSDR